LGIAIGSGADPIAGLLAGIIGGIVIGVLSGSHTSVSGPAAGLTAIVATQLTQLGSFETFLAAVLLAGVLQVGLGLLKAGALSAFFPSSVIHGLLAAIGLILIMGQLPLLLGLQKDLRGDGRSLSVGEAADSLSAAGTSPAAEPIHSLAAKGAQNAAATSAIGHPAADHRETGPPDDEIGEQISRFWHDMHTALGSEAGVQWAPLLIGLVSLLLLIAWDRFKFLKQSLVPAPLVVVILGAGLGGMFAALGTADPWVLAPQHYVFVPKIASWEELHGLVRLPDVRQLTDSAVQLAAVTIAIVASLETLLNLEAVDRLDKKRRVSPPNRELVAQGIGNFCCGLVGGLPVTSVVIRGSVNVNAGAQTKLAAIFHGVLLLGCVLAVPWLLNWIPLSCLAAILLVTGYKLTHPTLFASMARGGSYQWVPFLVTLSAIVVTDLLVGVLIGFGVSLLFILQSHLRQPVRQIREKHLDGEVLHIELGSQVSFLNRAGLEKAMRGAPRGSRLLLDARRTDYIDPDVLSLIREFCDKTAPALKIQTQLIGFRDHYQFRDVQDAVDYSILEARETLTPAQVLNFLREGNQRFIEGHPIDHDLRPHRLQGLDAQPIVAFYTGIDSKTPVEMLFDLGMGDAYVVRMPGAIYGAQALGGLEYAVAMGDVKVIVVMGRVDSRLIKLAAQQAASATDPRVTTAAGACLDSVLDELKTAVDQVDMPPFDRLSPDQQRVLIRRAAEQNVERTVRRLLENSSLLRERVAAGRLSVTTAMLDPATGWVKFSSAIGSSNDA
jgi:carbonic anhydrase/SulP family sulfate permease